jgi:hypothetical protein
MMTNTFFIISCNFFLEGKNVLDKICRVNQNPHFMFNNFFDHAICEIMWKNSVEPGRPEITIWCMYAGYLRLQKHSQNM